VWRKGYPRIEAMKALVRTIRACDLPGARLL